MEAGKVCVVWQDLCYLHILHAKAIDILIDISKILSFEAVIGNHICSKFRQNKTVRHDK